MKSMMGFGGHFLAGSVLLVAFSQEIQAHPHVFAEARLEVVINAERQVQTLRHVWRFDDLFSSTVLMEFDSNRDLELNADELKEVGAVVHESLAEFNYFQIITSNGKDVEMEAPPELIADYSDNQLMMLFETKPRDTLPLTGKVTLGVYDPTFYTAIDFTEDDYLQVKNLPSDCSAQVVRPDPDEALAENQQSLTDAFFDDPTGNDLSKIFATRLEITCKS